MKRSTLLRSAALAALALATTAAHAALFDLNYAGTFAPDTTLGGAGLGVDTPFSTKATFDTSASPITLYPGLVLYQVTALSFTLNSTTYTAVLGQNDRVLVGDDSYDADYKLVGLYNPDFNNYFFSFFPNSSNPSLDAAAPSPVTYSGASFHVAYATYPLVGVPGGLHINSSITMPNVSITSAAVPEPSEYAAVVGLALGVFALVHHRRQAAAR